MLAFAALSVPSLLRFRLYVGSFIAIFRFCGSFFRFFDASYVVLRFFNDFFRFWIDFSRIWEGFGRDFGRIFRSILVIYSKKGIL